MGHEAIRDESVIARLDRLSPVYHSFDGTGDLPGLAAAFKAAGGTIADLSILSGFWESDWRNAFAGVGIPAFAVGTNRVPKDMLAQIHKDEAIIPKAFNPWAGGVMPTGAAGGGNNARLEELVERLTQKVADLQGELVSIKTNTSGTPQMVRQFDQVSNGGTGLRTKAPA